jgi:hypothetical protein
MGTLITNTSLFRLVALRAALGMEVLGMKHSKQSVYAQVKKEFGYKGSKQSVFDQLDEYINQEKEK